jgi:hypothetical protein
MWVKQVHKPSPSQKAVFMWFFDHSQSWVVYVIMSHCFTQIIDEDHRNSQGLNLSVSLS